MWSSNLDVVLDISNRVVLDTIVQILTELTQQMAITRSESHSVFV